MATLNLPCPVPGCLAEEVNLHLATTFLQGSERAETSPEPPFLRAQQPQLPQLLLVRLVSQTLQQLHSLSLDMVQPLNVLPEGSELNAEFKVQPHQC